MSMEAYREYALSGDPASRLVRGDCRQVMRTLPSESIQCIFSDPPFNISEPYSTWKDSIPRREYLDFTYDWLRECSRLLRDDGCLWVNCPDEIVSRIDVFLEDECKLTRVRWCIWHFRFGQWTDRNFIVAKTHVPRWVKDPDRAIFNADDVFVTSDRRSKYKDKRTEGTVDPGLRPPFDVWGIPSDGPGWSSLDAIVDLWEARRVADEAPDEDTMRRMLGDLWGLPVDGENWGRVSGSSKERIFGHPNQLPEKYVERAVRSSSNPGEPFLTPFGGTGTEMVVARALGRPSFGIEIGEREAASAFARMKKGAVRIEPTKVPA